MLCETFTNRRQFNFGPVWNEVMDWIENKAAQCAGEFHSTVAGCRVNITSAKTKRLDSSLFESHRRMVDIQVALEGEEWLYVAPAEGLRLLDPYDETKDMAYHVVPESELGRLTLRPGRFAMLFPWDAHMPLVAVNNVPAPIRKLVAKLPLEALSLR